MMITGECWVVTRFRFGLDGRPWLSILATATCDRSWHRRASCLLPSCLEIASNRNPLSGPSECWLYLAASSQKSESASSWVPVCPIEPTMSTQRNIGRQGWWYLTMSTDPTLSTQINTGCRARLSSIHSRFSGLWIPQTHFRVLLKSNHACTFVAESVLGHPPEKCTHIQGEGDDNLENRINPGSESVLFIPINKAVGESQCITRRKTQCRRHLLLDL